MYRGRVVIRSLCGFLSSAVVFTAGCASPDRLTHDNFRQIKVKSSTEDDVRGLIGEPSHKLIGLWTYQRPDKHLSAMVDFDDEGRVSRVQWIDALGEVWEDSDASKRKKP